MKLLIVGEGGREHVLAWKLAQSPRVTEVICLSANPGIAEIARCESEPSGGIDEMARWARTEGIDLTVVGPEAYLSLGLVDAFQAQGLTVVGPTRRAAAIESSKTFAKELMARHTIPTAPFTLCDSPETARRGVRRMGCPVVVKAEGLAAGKGVTIARTLTEADRAIERTMVERVFGEAGDRVVLERFLQGEEASVLAFVDGERVLPMVAAQDHKAVGVGDTGPNTGGMGAYSPAPVISDAVSERVRRGILEPTVRAMGREGREYRGILYAGLMVTADGPQVIEFNCRFGDPEAQAVLPRLQSDLVEPLLATACGSLDDLSLLWDPRACACVVMASGGYPGEYRTGLPIAGLDEVAVMDDVLLFHSGTRYEEGRVVTDGGRVLGVTALGETIAQAVDRAYAAVQKIEFTGSYYRRDIGAKALGRSVT